MLRFIPAAGAWYTTKAQSRAFILSVHLTQNYFAYMRHKEYIVRQIDTDDEELKTFLFSLGCYEGEPITVVSHLKDSCVVSIKDGRYNIDNQLADAILI